MAVASEAKYGTDQTSREVSMSSNPRRVLAKSIEKRKRVLDAAAKVLARRGFAEATLSEIAQEVGTYAGSIYYYFPSREDLVMDVLMTSIDRLSSTLDQAVSGARDASETPLERVKSALRAVLALNTLHQDDYSRAYMRSFNQVPEEWKNVLSTSRHKTRGIWRELLKDAQDAGEISAKVDINIASLLIMGATNWVSTWYNPAGSLTGEEISDTFVNLLLDGLLHAE